MAKLMLLCPMKSCHINITANQLLEVVCCPLKINVGMVFWDDFQHRGILKFPHTLGKNAGKVSHNLTMLGFCN